MPKGIGIILLCINRHDILFLLEMVPQIWETLKSFLFFHRNMDNTMVLYGN